MVNEPFNFSKALFLGGGCLFFLGGGKAKKNLDSHHGV